jgi:hypothetical protein
MSVGVDVSIDDLINIGQIDVNRESAEERIYSIEIRE